MPRIDTAQGYDLKNLKKVVSLTKGKKPKINSTEKKRGFLPYLDIKALEKNEIVTYGLPEKCVLCNENDILMVWDGSRSGLVLKGKKGIVGSTLTKFHPEILLNTDYLFYYLKSKFNFLNTHTKGAAIPHVHDGLFWNLEIPLPSLDTQKKIVQKLDYILGQLEEKKKEIISRIEKFNAKKINQNYKNHLLKLAFDGTLTGEEFEIIDGVKVPKGWELKKTSDIIKILYGKGLSKDERDESGKFTVYGSNGVVGTHSEYLIDFPSIIIGRKGSVGTINLTPEKFWPTDVTYYVQLFDSKIPLKIIYYLLIYLNLPRLVQSGPKPGLNRNDVYNLHFLFPRSNGIQKKIVHILDKKFTDWENHKQELENIQNQHELIKKHLNNLSSSIFDMAFSGKLVN